MNSVVRICCVAALLSIVACKDEDSDSTPDAGPNLGQDAGPDGGSTTDGGADGGVDASLAYCQALCSHETACNPQDTSDFCDTAACTARASFYLDAARSALRACLSASCSVDEDACFTQTADALPTRSVDETFRTRCTARQSACPADLPSSLCASTNVTELLVPSAVQAGDACLSKPCAEVFDCVLEAWGSAK
ncbi:hypothetical protein [Hyalangium gracile]|uniref:hypothetical protein n=1 Tax=Hyalangium gracile TaxID=394092 RepID=UPI001CC93286|nr:hypothetical protein [Hyalangium gracile]